MTRVNWFSPMAPAKTDIAHYSARILVALQQRIEVRVWTAQGQVTPEVEKLAPVHHYDPQSPSWHELNRADLNIYNIGNNAEFHGAIWQMSRQSPGVVILHDECLQHLFADFFLNRIRDLAAYEREMSRFYGRAGCAIVADYLAGRYSTDELANRFPLTQLAIENCLGIVVHSQILFDAVKELSSAPVLYVPLPYPAASTQEKARWESIRIKSIRPPFRLAVFGYIGPNRRLEAIIKAIAAYPERRQFRLDIYGPVWDPGHILNYAGRVGLASTVRLHGYVEDLDAALATADLVLNLRYPTMGEASGTQLRIWSHALPSLVTRTGWYASLPENIVAFVNPENEIEDIQNHLTRFLDNPGAFVEMSERGRLALQRDHHPGNYANEIARIASLALAYRPYFEGLALAERVAGHIQLFQSEAAGECLIKRVSETIYSMSAADNVKKTRGQHV